MSMKVIECCYGQVIRHRGKGRCIADQGGRTMEVKLGCFNREDGEITSYTYTDDDGEEVTIPVFELDLDLVGMNCLNMVDCMMSTDPCGNQIEPTGYGIRHILVDEPQCDRGKALFALTVGADAAPVFDIADDVCFWLRLYGN